MPQFYTLSTPKCTGVGFMKQTSRSVGFPACSPKVNPAERLFEALRAALANWLLASLDA